MILLMVQKSGEFTHLGCIKTCCKYNGINYHINQLGATAGFLPPSTLECPSINRGFPFSGCPSLSRRGARGWIHGRYLCWCGSAQYLEKSSIGGKKSTILGSISVGLQSRRSHKAGTIDPTVVISIWYMFCAERLVHEGAVHSIFQSYQTARLYQISTVFLYLDDHPC